MPTTQRDMELAAMSASFAGYHPFTDCNRAEGNGSFEVFWHKFHCGPLEGSLYELPTGWYWWPCFPGCIPDGDATGPFPTAEGAYLDAIGE